MQFGVSQTLIALIILVTTVFILYSGRKLNEMVVNSIITAAQNERLVERLRIEIARAEKARRQTEEESERRSKFFAAANHDIRQPLQAMGIYIDILGRQGDASDRARRQAACALDFGHLDPGRAGFSPSRAWSSGRWSSIPSM